MFRYTLSVLLLFIGVMALYRAFRKPAPLVEKELPATGKGSRVHHVFVGVVCIACGILRLFYD